MTEDISKLPPGWSAAPLGELTRLNPRSFDTPPTDEQLLSFVPMASVEEESGRLNASVLRPWKEVKKGYTPFQDGDVLLAKITPCMENGKYAIARELKDGRGAGSTEFHILRPHRGVAPAFILNYLFQDSVRSEARLKMKGAAGQLRVPPEFLRDLVLPLPPEPEQERIVQEIEKQFTRLEAAAAALKRVQANLKRYRASLLKAACEGRLVPTEAELARRGHRSYEPGSALLGRILAERQARWEAKTLEKMSGSLQSPPDDRWRHKYKQPLPPDMTSVPELPDGWCWTQMGYAFDCVVPNRDKPESFTGTIPWLTLPDFGDGIEIEESKTGVGLSREEADRYRARVIPAGSVVMSCVGRFGITAVLKQAAVINQQLHAFLMPRWLPARFYAYALRSQSRYMEQLSTATTIAYLNKENCNSVPVPVPPLAEQYRICERLDRHVSVLGELEKELGIEMRRARSLRQAILKRAFEGKLVPQDPSDEPAGALLERIRGTANRGCAPSVQSPRGSRRKPLGKKETGNA